MNLVKAVIPECTVRSCLANIGDPGDPGPSEKPIFKRSGMFDIRVRRAYLSSQTPTKVSLCSCVRPVSQTTSKVRTCNAE
jgi:hypothetical protein